MPKIVWFNIPAGDTGRARTFYEDVFAWRIRPFPGMEQEGYLEIETGGVGGEIIPRPHAGEPLTVFIGVPSVEEYAARVQKAGGRVVIPKRAVPGRGYFVICEDTEQNRLGLWESDPTAA